LLLLCVKPYASKNIEILIKNNEPKIAFTKIMNSKIALGTVQFGSHYGINNQHGRVIKQEASEIIKYAQKCGVDTLDTAIAYGDSEQYLGEIGVQYWKVISKLPKIPESVDDISTWIQQTVSESLKRIGVPKLYGLLLHYPEQLLGEQGREIYESLESIKQSGWTEKIGISIYSHKELDILLERYTFELVQAPCNIFDRNLIQSGWLDILQKMGVEVHIRSVFLQGLLLMEAQDRPEKFKRWQPLWHKWDEWLGQINLTPLEACLNYALSLQSVAKIIIGVDSVDQFKEILQTKKLNLEIPDFLVSNEVDLINPSNWKNL